MVSIAKAVCFDGDDQSLNFPKTCSNNASPFDNYKQCSFSVWANWRCSTRQSHQVFFFFFFFCCRWICSLSCLMLCERVPIITNILINLYNFFHYHQALPFIAQLHPTQLIDAPILSFLPFFLFFMPSAKKRLQIPQCISVYLPGTFWQTYPSFLAVMISIPSQASLQLLQIPVLDSVPSIPPSEHCRNEYMLEQKTNNTNEQKEKKKSQELPKKEEGTAIIPFLTQDRKNKKAHIYYHHSLASLGAFLYPRSILDFLGLVLLFSGQPNPLEPLSIRISHQNDISCTWKKIENRDNQKSKN